MKKNILLPRIALLAIFFVVSIFTKINAQIIVPDIVYSDVSMKNYCQDTLVIYGKNNEQLASIQIYEVSESNTLTLKKSINYNNIDKISSNLLQLKKNKTKSENNTNTNQPIPLKTLGEVSIKDLPNLSKGYYLINVSFVNTDKTISIVNQFFTRKCNGNTSDPNKPSNKN